MNRILIDSGPLVAMISSVEQRHAICVETARHLFFPVYTCWPVLTEAVWLLGQRRDLVRELLAMVGPARLHILALEDADVAPMDRILERYASLRPDLADAALVHLAERENIDTVFTLDRRDFSVYRTSQHRRLRILPELPS